MRKLVIGCRDVAANLALLGLSLAFSSTRFFRR